MVMGGSPVVSRRSWAAAVQKAVLNALAALAKDNHDVAIHLAKILVGKSSTGACFRDFLLVVSQFCDHARFTNRSSVGIEIM
jgi:hypothetical protein